MPEVIYEKRERVAYVTLNRPESLNAYTQALLGTLNEVWKEFDRDPEARVAVLCGRGRAFCAGADLNEVSEQAESTQPREYPVHAGGFLLRKPVVAAVHGHCLAGGLGMALASDIRVASEDATFGLPMVKWGITPAAVLPYLVAAVPLGVAMELAYTGDTIDAQEACRVGLVNEVVAPSQLTDAAERLAKRIAANAPAVVQSAREVVIHSLGQPLPQALRMGQLVNDLLAKEGTAREGSEAWRRRRMKKNGTPNP